MRMGCSEEKLESKRQYEKETYQFRKRRGWCVRCGKERALLNHVMCPDCIEEIRIRDAGRVETDEQRERRTERQRAKYTSRKESGKCVRCGKKSATVGTKCLECYIKHKKAQTEWRLRTGQKKGYAESGLCIRCGAEAEKGRNLCCDCLEKSRKSAAYARGFIPKQLMIERF